MKNLPRFLGIIALIAVIGFTAASCSDGGGGGGNPGGGGDPGNPGSPGVQKPVVPLKETYVSYDTDGNEYKLVITEVVGRTLGRDLDPTKNYTYTLTITFIDGTKATSTGTVAAKDIKTTKDDEGNVTIVSIDLKHTGTGTTIIVNVSGSEDSDTGAFTFDSDNENSTIPVDRNSAVKDVPIVDLPYSRTKDGKGWIITSGKSFVKNGVADLPAIFRDLPVVGIGGSAFANNKNLISVTIPASITSIEGWANFENCTNLTTVTFAPNSKLEYIGAGAFMDCTSLSSIEIPASVTYMGGWGAFWRCTNLKTVTFETGSKLKTIGGGTFADCTSLTSITIPASVTHIGLANSWGAFARCTNLKTVTFETGSKLETIGLSAFADCTNLSAIEIPASVTYIHYSDDGWEGAFVNCTNLKTVTFAQNSQLKTIGKWFENCTSLTSIEIPASVTSIGNAAFAGCTDLTSVTIPASVTSIGNDVFAGWTASQTINIQGHASEASADAAWGAAWRWACDAKINYNA